MQIRLFKNEQETFPWSILLLCWGLYALLLAGQAFTHYHLNTVDGMYHLRFARLYWERGLFVDFPWMAFSTAKDVWVDHHFLFHIVLVPFSWLELPDAVRASGVFFGSLSLTACLAYLYAHRVRYVWIFGILLVACSSVFMFRIAMARAMSLALVLFLLAMWCMETRRDRWLLVLSFVFIWTYQTAIALLPMAMCAVLWRRWVDKSWEFQPLIYTSLGLVLGLVINPFFPKTFAFLYFHLISGHANTVLTIGREWSTPSLWKYISLNYPIIVMGILFPLWAWTKRSLWPKDIGLLLLGSIALFLASFRAVRMMEYAAPFGLLLAARLADAIWFRKNDSVTQGFEKTGEHSGTAEGDNQSVSDKLEQEEAEEIQEEGTFVNWKRWQKSLLGAFLASVLVAGVWYQRDLHLHSFVIRHGDFAGASQWLKHNTPEKSLVFHSDWTEFAYLFFHNSHNIYLSGLNPHFFYSWNPDLYRLYRKIVTGIHPSPVSAIQKHFKARYIFIHRRKQTEAFREQLAHNFCAKVVYRDRFAQIFMLCKNGATGHFGH